VTSSGGLGADPVYIARQLLRQEGENRVLRLRLQEIKQLCETNTLIYSSRILDVINREMPKEVL
jgi:hypothetical protein